MCAYILNMCTICVLDTTTILNENLIPWTFSGIKLTAYKLKGNCDFF